jgi:hypothetical protein
MSRGRILLATGIVVAAVAILATAFAPRVPDRPGTSAAPGLAALDGRWLPPDRGYVLEVRSAEGAVQATYCLTTLSATRLGGEYFKAALGQTFPVWFQRLK